MEKEKANTERVNEWLTTVNIWGSFALVSPESLGTTLFSITPARGKEADYLWYVSTSFHPALLYGELLVLAHLSCLACLDCTERTSVAIKALG